jgi:hypothetical protein
MSLRRQLADNVHAHINFIIKKRQKKSEHLSNVHLKNFFIKSIRPCIPVKGCFLK